MTGGFIPAHGGYEKLLSYQKAEIVYDATVYFCDRFVDKRDRTHDQMVQAARSGKQNILEGSEASRHLQGNRDQTHQRRPRQPRRNSSRTTATSCASADIAEWAQGSPLRPSPARTQPHS